MVDFQNYNEGWNAALVGSGSYIASIYGASSQGGFANGEMPEGWKIVGVGVYGAASGAGGAGYGGEIGMFEIFSQPGKTFKYGEYGPAVGYDLGVSVGGFVIYGPPDLKASDLNGYGVGLSGGFGIFDGTVQTSATFDGLPTWNYLIVGGGFAVSIPGASTSPVQTTVKEYKPLPAEFYFY